jgi:MOSC domain-containing protein YiiM
VARIHQISASNGGVPKLPLSTAEISESGVVGDLQADQAHHGGPDQALCLYSLEVIEQLQAEGHPIYPGAAGENITIAGMDWGRVRPGMRMTLGHAVEIEITRVTAPCRKNAQWFKQGRFGRMSDTRHPGSSRMYARVVSGGRLVTGDSVELLP